MQREKPVRLILVSGTAFHGWSFGAREAASGEVIFNTAATGYRESLTDPSGKGQILTLIYHIIGNNEVPAHSETDVISDFFGSGYLHLFPLILMCYFGEYSHLSSEMGFSGHRIINDTQLYANNCLKNTFVRSLSKAGHQIIAVKHWRGYN